MTETTTPDTPQQQTQAEQAATPARRRKLRLRPLDVIIFAVMLGAIIGLSATLITKISLKHDVSDAQVVSDKAIADLQKRDGQAAYKLGTPTFQKTYTADQLTKQFKAVAVATSKPPTLDRKMVADSKNGTRNIFFIYKYNTFKVPFYIRTGLIQKSGAWQLTAISGDVDESKLIIN